MKPYKIKLCFVREITLDKEVSTDENGDTFRNMVVTDKNGAKVLLQFRGDTRDNLLIKGLN